MAVHGSELTDVTQLNFITAEKGWAVAEGNYLRLPTVVGLGYKLPSSCDVGEFIAKLKLQ